MVISLALRLQYFLLSYRYYLLLQTFCDKFYTSWYSSCRLLNQHSMLLVIIGPNLLSLTYILFYKSYLFYRLVKFNILWRLYLCFYFWWGCLHLYLRLKSLIYHDVLNLNRRYLRCWLLFLKQLQILELHLFHLLGLWFVSDSYIYLSSVILDKVDTVKFRINFFRWFVGGYLLYRVQAWLNFVNF